MFNRKMRCFAAALLFLSLCRLDEFTRDAVAEQAPVKVHPTNTAVQPKDALSVKSGVTSGLTLDQAVTLALENNQELAALESRLQGERAAIVQSGLLPNPELEVTVENFGGSQETSGFDSSETTFALSQPVELGGKRRKRRTVAQHASEVAGWEYMEKKVNLIADVKIGFNEVLADQQRVLLAEEQLRLAEQVLRTVQARVEAGKVSRLEETRARTTLSTSRIALKNAQGALEASKSKLSALWGGRMPVFDSAVGELGELGAVQPDFRELGDRVLKHPSIGKRAAEVAQNEAALNLSLAGRIPDITISGGVRRFEATKDNALVAGVSIPLGVFDRNQGTIGQARYQLSAAKAELSAARTDIEARLQRACQTLSAARAEAQALQDDVLPGAREAFAAAQEGYKQGKFGYLELLDTQKILTDMTRSHIDAISAYQNAYIEVERLTGQEMTKSIPAEKQ